MIPQIFLVDKDFYLVFQFWSWAWPWHWISSWQVLHCIVFEESHFCEAHFMKVMLVMMMIVIVTKINRWRSGWTLDTVQQGGLMGRSSLLVEKAQGSTLFGTKGSTKKGFFRNNEQTNTDTRNCEESARILDLGFAFHGLLINSQWTFLVQIKMAAGIVHR